jgi:hypothetical protein
VHTKSAASRVIGKQLRVDVEIADEGYFGQMSQGLHFVALRYI